MTHIVPMFAETSDSRLLAHVVSVDGVLREESVSASVGGSHSRPARCTSGAFVRFALPGA
jgi:hypothetical protein